MRRAAKRDTVETEIVAALRAFGWSVVHLSLTDGPDLLIGKYRTTFLAEVKTGRKELRERQARWHAAWRGSIVLVLRTVDDVKALERSCRAIGGELPPG